MRTVLNYDPYGNVRNIAVKIEIGNMVLTNDDVISLSYENRITENDNISIGDVCSSMCEILLIPPRSLALLSAEFTLSIGINNVYCPVGIFYVSSINKEENDLVKITAYDKISQLTKNFTSNGVQTLEGVIDSICENNGLNRVATTLPDIPITTYPEDATDRDMLGYMSGLMGKNAYINKDGELDFVWFNSNGLVLSDDDLIDIETKDSSYVISALTCENNDEELVSGEGRTLRFSNPYMTQEILDDIREANLPISYNSNELVYQGDSRIDVGDILVARGMNIPVMSHTIEFGDVLQGVIKSFGASTKEQEVQRESAEQREIRKHFSILEQAFTEATEKIIGQGGYVQDIFENGVRVAIQIKSNSDSNHLWQWSYGGLAYSNDGGQTFNNIAITNDGHISATAIDTGRMSAERIMIAKSDGTETTTTFNQFFKVDYDENDQLYLVIGNQANQIQLREFADHIGFYDGQGNELAIFTTNGLEFAQLKRIKLGNFEISTRSNGSLDIR